ncbi:hypothetical protein PO002_19380, partial [Cupriavidus necator]|uniref:hypothetical protein n=1 Tax=Cupriavidus necator TaxID=106590 RepID=UPI0039C26718
RLRRCVSSRERDYAELSSFRQPFQQSFFAAVSAANLAAPTSRSTPQPLLRLLCSAALCCEGANIKGPMQAWQAILRNNSKHPQKRRLSRKCRDGDSSWPYLGLS